MSTARQCNGSSDYLVSASDLAPGSPSKIAVAFWLWLDADETDTVPISYAAGGSANGTGAFFIQITTTTVYVQMHDNGINSDQASCARPSSDAWHHYVVNIDYSQAGNHCTSIFIDGSDASRSADTTWGSSGFTAGDGLLYLGNHSTGSFYLKGRLCQPALWAGVNLVEAEAADLHNGPANSGKLPNAVQAGSLPYYWAVGGSASPETPTVGAINLTVNGTTQVAGPSQLDAPAGPAVVYAPGNRMVGVAYYQG